MEEVNKFVSQVKQSVYANIQSYSIVITYWISKKVACILEMYSITL